VTDVAPQVRVMAYLCSVCGYESYQSVNNKDFTPLTQCPSPACTKNDTKGKLMAQVRGSKFVRYQSIRLQEMHTEVPVGHIPRTTTVRVYGSLTRVMKPGDLVTVSGIFLVAPYHGFRAVRAGLTTDTFIEAMHVVPSKKSYALAATELDEKTQEEIEERSKDQNIYQNLAASIAPEIYGHVDIKKALMLLLVVSARATHLTSLLLFLLFVSCVMLIELRGAIFAPIIFCHLQSTL
jgi:DNA replication licensing factor MCM7